MDWFNNPDIKLQVVIISSLTSIVIFLFGWILKVVYERNSLDYKLKKEYQFEQKKKLKEEIAKNKMHLLNAAEELNQRLWNFSQYVDENWHKVNKNDWFKTEQYYINSFVYRFLKFIFWTLKTEEDTISIDSTIADQNDILFLKYVKTFKDLFTNADLLTELSYDKKHNTNHFFKNDLKGYCKWVAKEDSVIDFDDFKENLKTEYDSLEKVIEYFSTITSDDSDKNLNILRFCHLILIQFLNTFGHDYQRSSPEKIKKITKLYKPKMRIKEEMANFIKKNKLENELFPIYKKIKKIKFNNYY